MKFTKSNIISNIRLNQKKIKQLITLLFSFVALKSLVYFAPLGISSTINSIKKYGEFEYVLNIGQTLIGIFSMGFASGYAFFIIKNKRDDLKPVFHFHFLILCTLLLSISILYHPILNNIYFGAIILGIAFSDQILISAILKLNGKNSASVIIDTGVYIVMGILFAFCYFKIVEFSNSLWHSLILLTLVLTSIFFHFKRINGIKKIKSKDFIEIYKYGGLIIIASPLLYLITNNTRIFLEYFNGYESVGIYSLFFRLSSFILVIYRIIGILMYKRFFTSEHSKLDKQYSLIIFGLFLFNVILFFIIPIILYGRYEIFTKEYNENKKIFFICMFQVNFWITTALFEPIIHREYKTKSFIYLLTTILLLFISILYTFHYLKNLDIEKTIILNSIFILAVSFGQILILKKNNLFYKKTMYSQITLGVIFIVGVLLY